MAWIGDVDWQAVGTFVALIGVIGSLYLTRRGHKQDRTIAESTAARSEAAARLTEDYTRRVVDALEAMATRAAFGGTAEPSPRVEWRLEHYQGDRYQLSNTGMIKAIDVDVSVHQSMIFRRGDWGPDVEAGEAVTFIAAAVLATSDRTVTVDWTQPDGTGGVWRYPLPPKR